MKRFGSIVLLAALTGIGGCSDETFVEPPPEVVASDFELQTDMRELWTAHVVWTRFVVMASVAGLPEAADATQRLLENQDDIADALRPFYGDAAADEVRRLLREHITIALDVVYGATTGDPDAAIAAWYANADAIARALADLNPSWAYADLQSLMRVHLDTTVAEVEARLASDWAGDVEAFDAVLEHVLVMSDVLSRGVAAQFPELVPPSNVSERDRTLHLSMRALWQDHVIWTRVYIMAATSGLPEAIFSAERLLRNQDEIGDAISPFYGDAAGDALAALLREHITLAVDVVYNAGIDSGPGTQAAIAAWYDNADAIALFLSEANPHLAFADVQALMHAHLGQTIEETNARLAEDWPRDIVVYDEIVLHIVDMSDVIAGGIATQFRDGAL